MMKLVVLTCLIAAASAQIIPGYFGYAAPFLTPYSSNYRGPLSLAPGQPANILAADGRPLDTLDVNLDKSAHLTAKALSGGLHYLKKRSVAVAPLAYSAHLAPAHFAYPAPLAHLPFAHAPLIQSPYTYGAPLAHAIY